MGMSPQKKKKKRVGPSDVKPVAADKPPKPAIVSPGEGQGLDDRSPGESGVIDNPPEAAPPPEEVGIIDNPPKRAAAHPAMLRPRLGWADRDSIPPQRQGPDRVVHRSAAPTHHARRGGARRGRAVDHVHGTER